MIHVRLSFCLTRRALKCTRMLKIEVHLAWNLHLISSDCKVAHMMLNSINMKNTIFLYSSHCYHENVLPVK